MAYHPSGWSERQAEEITDDLVDRESLPASIKTEMVEYLEEDEPVAALEVFLESRTRGNKASD
jgi:hypothetical protein